MTRIRRPDTLVALDAGQYAGACLIGSWGAPQCPFLMLGSRQLPVIQQRFRAVERALCAVQCGLLRYTSVDTMRPPCG